MPGAHVLANPSSQYSVYGQFAIFIFAAWAGTSNGGVIAGLAVCGVVVAAVSQAAVLMQVWPSCGTTLPSCVRSCDCCAWQQDSVLDLCLQATACCEVAPLVN